MKRCPFCGEENLDQAAACYFCGRDLPAQTDDDVEPTQPRHVVRRGTQGPAQTYQSPPQPPDSTQPGAYGPQYTAPKTPPYPPPQPQSHTGYTQPYPPTQHPQYSQPGAGQPPSAYPPGYPPPQQPPQPPQYPPYYQQPQPPQPERSRLGIIVPIFLGMVLLCVCLVAAWAVADTANRSIARIGDQIATGAAGIFGGSATDDAPPATPLSEEPSPWPTFTPETTAEPEPTTPGAAEKLLTPECRAALDTLSGLTSQLSDEPLKLLDESWRAGFNQARLDLTNYCGTLDAASPVPAHVEEAHNALVQANAEFDLANQLLEDAVDGRDPGKILEAAQHFGQAARNLNSALAALRDVVE